MSDNQSLDNSFDSETSVPDLHEFNRFVTIVNEMMENKSNALLFNDKAAM